MKPNEINAIVTFRKVKDVEYIDLVEAGSKLDSEVLSWFVIYILRTGKNLRYVINGGVNRIGNKDFLAMEL